jgi:hypothetical protein
MLDSASWRCVEAVPAIRFALEGRSSIRPRTAGRRTMIRAAEGRVLGIEEARLWLGEGDDVALSYSLPASIDLAPLVGRRVRVAIRHEPLREGPNSQLLTIADEDGPVRLIAHFGEANGHVHAIGDTHVRVALSLREGGPIAFGTEHLQCLVQVGEHVLLRDRDSAYVMEFIARSRAGYAAYAIVDRALWRGAN